MIASHLSEASLNDYAEDRLTGAELARAEQHLAECVRCRRAANRLTALLERLRDLPRELDPAADLLPSIRAETQRRRATLVQGEGARFRRRGAALRAQRGGRRRQGARSGRQGAGSGRQRALREPRWPRATVAAAAAALFVAGTALTVLVSRSAIDGGAADRAADAIAATGDGGTSQQLDAGTTEDGAPMQELRRLDAEYARATDELLAAFREERDRLGDGTVRMIEENILTVDRALRQSRQALSTDPRSPVLRELVLDAHRQRLDVVRRAAAVAGGI